MSVAKSPGETCILRWETNAMAIRKYNRAINQNSGLATAYLNRIVVWHQMGRTSEVKLDFGRALNQARSQNLISIIQQVYEGR